MSFQKFLLEIKFRQLLIKILIKVFLNLEQLCFILLINIKNYYTTPDLLNNNTTDLDFIYNNKCNTHPHQTYFEILSELGLIGFLLFFSFFFYLIYKSIKCYLNNKNKILLSSLLFIFAQIIPLLPSGSFFTNFGATIFWINVSIIYSINKKYEKSIS